MKWIELIVVRSTDSQHKPAVRELVNLFAQNSDITTKFYQNAFVKTDLAIHLEWEIDGAEPLKSKPGIELAAALEGFGRIHHTVWVADEGVLKANGRER